MNKLFIIGAPRSGTTLLRLVLTNHPEIHIPAESPFILKLLQKYSFGFAGSDRLSNRILKELHRTDKSSIINRWGLNAEAFLHDSLVAKDKSFADTIDWIYTYSIPKNKRNVVYWGDKNNSYQLYVSTIHKLYPEAKFIHIVRDPRAVYYSYKKLSQKNLNSSAPKLPKNSKMFSIDWTERMYVVDKFKRHSTNILEIKYEDLVENTEETLLGVCKFLNLTYSSEMLRYHQKQTDIIPEPDDFEQWKNETQNPIHSKSVEEWRSQLDKNDQKSITSITYPYLREYYRLDKDERNSVGFIVNTLISIKKIKVFFREFRYKMAINILCKR